MRTVLLYRGDRCATSNTDIKTDTQTLLPSMAAWGWRQHLRKTQASLFPRRSNCAHILGPQKDSRKFFLNVALRTNICNIQPPSLGDLHMSIYRKGFPFLRWSGWRHSQPVNDGKCHSPSRPFLSCRLGTSSPSQEGAFWLPKMLRRSIEKQENQESCDLEECRCFQTIIV
jgi:hypothetical protein